MELKVFPRHISSTPSASGISASQTHLLTLNQMSQTRCAKNLVPDWPGIVYLWSQLPSSLDWQIGWAFSSLAASSRHSCSNLLLIVLRTVLNTKLVLSGSRTSSLFSFFWLSLTPLSDFIASSIISVSCSKVRWADGLILWCSWNSSQCIVFHRQAFGPNNMRNIINSIDAIRTYINTINLFPTYLLIRRSFIFFRSLRSLSILISSAQNWL